MGLLYLYLYIYIYIKSYETPFLEKTTLKLLLLEVVGFEGCENFKAKSKYQQRSR